MPIYARTSSGEYKPLDAVYAKNSSGEMISLPIIRNQNGSVFEIRTIDTELPVTLKTNGSYIQNYKLKGKTVQSGTPTPDSPIEPEFVGERTGESV